MLWGKCEIDAIVFSDFDINVQNIQTVCSLFDSNINFVEAICEEFDYL